MGRRRHFLDARAKRGDRHGEQVKQEPENREGFDARLTAKTVS